MTDLNTLIPANSPFVSLLFAHGLNSLGEIAGFGLTNGGEVHAFLAIPTNRDSDAESADFETRGLTGAVPLPETARKLLFRLLRTPGWESGSERKP